MFPKREEELGDCKNIYSKEMVNCNLENFLWKKRSQIAIKELSGDLCKNGPGHFASEKKVFSSNFAQ